MSIHMVGVGGAGMSGIARVLAQRGQVVTGCDREESLLTKKLIAEGIACEIGHSAEHAENAERLIVSGAIPDDAPELIRARELGLPIQHRAEALAEILREHTERVVVTGVNSAPTPEVGRTGSRSSRAMSPIALCGNYQPRLVSCSMSISIMSTTTTPSRMWLPCWANGPTPCRQTD